MKINSGVFYVFIVSHDLIFKYFALLTVYRTIIITVISKYLSKTQICAYFYVDMQNLVKVGLSASRVVAYFQFSKWRQYTILDINILCGAY